MRIQAACRGYLRRLAEMRVSRDAYHWERPLGMSRSELDAFRSGGFMRRADSLRDARFALFRTRVLAQLERARANGAPLPRVAAPLGALIRPLRN